MVRLLGLILVALLAALGVMGTRPVAVWVGRVGIAGPMNEGEIASMYYFEPPTKSDRRFRALKEFKYHGPILIMLAADDVGDSEQRMKRRIELLKSAPGQAIPRHR